jgi:hypothetical protein
MTSSDNENSNSSSESFYRLVLEEEDSNCIFESILNEEILNASISSADKASLKADGSERKRNRENYERSAKYTKIDDPWKTKWLLSIKDPTVGNINSRAAKEFRRSFRVPFIIFEEIITMLKLVKDVDGNPEPIFVYSDTLVGGKKSIPLELKVLCALRIMASGLKFRDAAEMSGYSQIM